MLETPKRLQPTLPVRQRLFALSRNVCAFHGCSSSLINESGTFEGQICHIEAALPGGGRFNQSQSNEDRRSFDNLILMCYPHHIKTNNEQLYTVSKLREIKTEHENKTSCSHQDSGLLEKFLDQSLGQEIIMPKNFGKLDFGDS